VREHARAVGPGVIESAFDLLELLRGLGRLRLAELTKESELPRTTVYRLLGQLRAVGAVERVGAHYRLGPSLLSLAHHVTPLDQLRAVAQRPLIELAASTRAQVALLSMSGNVPIYLELLRGAVLPLRREPGEPAPANSAAERVLRSGERLAINDGSSMYGVSCAAHLLKLPGGEVAAVSVVVPTSRFPRELVAPLKSTVARIAGQLDAQTSRWLPAQRGGAS
jgi:DNA-binding IclR family transcriptional regulator